MATSDIINEHKQTARAFGERLLSGRFDDLRELCTDDAVFRDPAFGPDGADFDSMVDYFERTQEAMSDIEYEIVDMVAEGDHLFYRGRLTATHSGEFMGIAPTNRRVSVEDHIEFRFEGDEIAETWAQYDAMGMMRQIGEELPGPA